ncbi:MAG: hypothetical protein RIS76_1112 [Verrucomicrobiota bacterium]
MNRGIEPCFISVVGFSARDTLFRVKRLLSVMLVLGVLLAVTGLAFARRQPALPDPNGYDRLVALAVGIPDDVTYLPRTNSPAVIAFALGHTNLMAEVAATLTLPSQIPLQYSLDDPRRTAATGADLRRLAKALLACALHRETVNDSTGSTEGCLASIALGQQAARGGLMIDFFIGSAIQIFSLSQLSNSITGLDAVSIQRATEGLTRLRASQEPLGNFTRRERRWILVGSGWWQDWDALTELPTDLLRTTTKASLVGSFAERFTDLEQAYAGTEAALQRRSLELARPEAPQAPTPVRP